MTVDGDILLSQNKITFRQIIATVHDIWQSLMLRMVGIDLGSFLGLRSAVARFRRSKLQLTL